MSIYFNIAAVLISLGALVFSIVSFKRSQKIKRIENYLQFGTPKKIDKELEYLEREKIEVLAELERQHIKRRKAIINDFSGRGQAHSSTMKQALRELDDQKGREAEKIKREFNHKIDMLKLKKENLAKL